MFGYVTPVKANLRQQDYVLYRAFYCGICAAIGRGYGALPRFSTNYDITFLSLLVHDVTNMNVELGEQRCIGNPLKKKLMVTSSALLDKLCAANIILTRHKLNDDVIDGGGVKKRVVRSALRRPYERAKAAFPEADAIVGARYAQLRELEKRGEKGVDRVAHCFASMLAELTRALVGDKADENVYGLCYNVGKFVYLADALDDVDEDRASGNYNPFLAVYGDCGPRKEFFAAHLDEISFTLNAMVNRAIECFNSIRFTQSYTLLKNIVYEGLRGKIAELLGSEKKLPPPKI